MDLNALLMHARQRRGLREKSAALFLAPLIAISASCAFAQSAPTEAAKPDLLVMHHGAPVRDSAAFLEQRRPEIFLDVQEHVYGRTPQAKLPAHAHVTSTDPQALGGLAIRRQITITIGNKQQRQIHILLYLPAHATGPVGVFVGLNFDGNQTVSADPGIDLSTVYLPDPALDNVQVAKELKGHIRQTAKPETRGTSASQWQVEAIVRAGYGLATVYAGDIEPDFATGIGYGVRPLLFKDKQWIPEADGWGAIGAWAWGMSRMVDYLLTDPAIDGKKIIAFGHSRFGKTALWAGAQDPRFAMVISNESGQGGASLSKPQRAETVAHLNIAFPYWFSPNYHNYTGRTDALPVDGHFVLALIAPRPLYVSSAIDDPYSDPQGEFESVVAASAVYRLFGKQAVDVTAMPPVEHPVGGVLRYHLRSGPHDVTEYDWQQYLKFADDQFKH